MVLTIAICFAVVGMAFGQVNIEKYRGKKGISGNINLQLNSAAGNADFFDGGAAANLTLIIGRTWFTWIRKWQTLRQSRISPSSNYMD